MAHHDRPRRGDRRRQLLWFIALWCLGVGVTAALTLPLHLLVVWAK
ncbi:hypothetical protein PCO31010_03995 [Pandoraea commovens]|uniref:DUF2474 domain-containing protein n=1 Tax=Pandoraea commovens TaxID=2508289 RepID=A0A5E4XN47_9BURK|nr:hypothetical protein PCO31010_03995 [Pandoraea commovens]